MNAKAIPTEQMIRYFHIASSDRRLGWSEIRKAVSSVVASMPTHMMPRLLDISTSSIAVWAPSHSTPKRRAMEVVKTRSSASCVKYMLANAELRANTSVKTTIWNDEKASM